MRAPIPILTYHQVETPPADKVPFRSLIVPPGAFARQMALLSMLGWRGLSMGALEPYLRGEKTGKVVGLTFDDGYVNNVDHALPVLERHGFSATCYVVSGQLGGSNVWDHAIGVPPKPLMTAAHMRQWLAGGQEIGSHTRHHVDLTKCGAATAREEIAGGRRDLEQLLGTAVRHFCYPFGFWRPEHEAMARDAGFTTATTTQRGRTQPSDDLFALPRVPVVRSTSLPVLWLKVASGYEDGKRKAPVREPDAA